MTTRPSDQQPLLPSSHPREHETHSSQASTTSALRLKAQTLLSSPLGRYIILALIGLDISIVFSEFLITSLACDGSLSSSSAETAEKVLSVFALTFSSLFMVELGLTLWAYGRSYLIASKIHILDALVILLSFGIDLAPYFAPSEKDGGGSEELFGRLVIVLRLWRVFKIVEELGVSGAQGQMVEPLEERVKELEEENRMLKRRLAGRVDTEEREAR
jgi:hypothetical protein